MARKPHGAAMIADVAFQLINARIVIDILAQHQPQQGDAKQGMAQRKSKNVDHLAASDTAWELTRR